MESPGEFVQEVGTHQNVGDPMTVAILLYKQRVCQILVNPRPSFLKSTNVLIHTELHDYRCASERAQGWLRSVLRHQMEERYAAKPTLDAAPLTPPGKGEAA